jgi:Baseplate J-like protein
MALPAPNLDSRRFQDLVDEARARIPRYTPEWTNFNDSDPGMTLVQLHAWMTETLLYELNRVPELNYIKFLDLLGIMPEPAHPALTELTFRLEKLDKPGDDLVVNIPRLTKVAVDDPDLPAEVIFETDRTLLAINAAIGALIVPRSGGGAQTRQLVSFYDADATSWPHAFETLPAASGAALYLGLVLRPIRSGDPGAYAEDKLPAGPLDLYADAVRVFDQAPDGGVIEGPVATRCTPPGAAGVPVTHLEWHIFTGTGADGTLFEDDSSDAGWTRLSLSADGTRGLSGSGHLVFEIPAAATALDPLALSAGFWTSFGAVRPPRDKAELEEQLHSGSLDIAAGLADFWEVMGATAEQVDELAACGEDAVKLADVIADPAYELDPTALTLEDWLSVNEGYGAALPQTAEAYRKLHWIRARLAPLPPDATPPAPMRGLHLNTVPATQAATRLDDRLGRSNGRPAQVVRLPKVPVLIAPATGEPDIELQILEEGQSPVWVRVDDFFRSGPDDPHYMLDPATGTITLGDGRRGRIPVADAQVTATRYRVGGGSIGNVGAGLVTKIKGRLRGVAGVTNLRASHDGSDAEPLDEVKLRAPHDLRMRDRAVSAEDFAELALRTPGVALHKAFALPRRAVGADGTLLDKDGSVTLLVLPVSDHLTPQPDEDQKRAICRWLEPRRLITTELHIIGPRYSKVTRLQARLTVRQDHDLGAVAGAVLDALIAFLDPITGGEDGTGWPFGQDIFYGDLYERILAVEGVRRASRLSVEIDDEPGDSATDIAAIPEGHLPALSREAIDLEVAYG